MNREIKFRAWNGKSMDMIDDLYWFEENHVHENGDGYGCENIIMQFTGLHDNNGNEIYEGDIVVKDGYIWFDDGEPNYRGTVEWIFSQWQVVAHCVNKNKRGISDGNNEGINEDGFEDGENTDWLVIGNIYENPELLT